MNASDIQARVIDIIRSVAPEVDAAALRPDRALRDQVDLDSMDWLRVIVTVHERLHVDIPEKDYAKLRTLGDWSTYLAPKLAAGGGA